MAKRKKYWLVNVYDFQSNGFFTPFYAFIMRFVTHSELKNLQEKKGIPPFGYLTLRIFNRLILEIQALNLQLLSNQTYYPAHILKYPN